MRRGLRGSPNCLLYILMHQYFDTLRPTKCKICILVSPQKNIFLVPPLIPVTVLILPFFFHFLFFFFIFTYFYVEKH